MSSHSEKMKAKRWGGGLKLMGRCFNGNDPEDDPFPPNLLVQNEQKENTHQDVKNENTHQNQTHPTRKALGLPKIAPRATKPSKQEGDQEGQRKVKGSSSTGNLMHMVKDVKELRHGHGYDNVDNFTFEELKYATKHFRPDLILGEGGFGAVYKGVLDESVRPKYKPPILVAIKQLNRNGIQGEREWLTEVNYLAQLSYSNLVKLIGYCCDGDQRLLVYEYMASGSLEKHLFRRSSRTMTWLRRIKAALDAAKGLAYLHGLEQPIIYRDLKTSNVLLDENFNAKLSDFGLAKEGPKGDQTHVSTRVMGTYGYAAPEYMMTGHLTAMSDVYSFGVVLLELLIGKRVLEKSKSNREQNLVELCRPVLNNSKKLPRILDSRIDGQYSTEAMMRVANLAYQCLSSTPKVRPMMRQVVQILEPVYDQETEYRENLRDKKDKDDEDGKEKMHMVEEERQPRENRRRREERSRSEPQNEFHLCTQNSVDVISKYEKHKPI